MNKNWIHDVSVSILHYTAAQNGNHFLPIQPKLLISQSIRVDFDGCDGRFVINQDFKWEIYEHYRTIFDTIQL